MATASTDAGISNDDCALRVAVTTMVGRLVWSDASAEWANKGMIEASTAGQANDFFFGTNSPEDPAATDCSICNGDA
jgi:hypothetical protein